MAKKIIYDGQMGAIGESLAHSLNLLENSFVCVNTLEQVEKGLLNSEVDAVLFVASDATTVWHGNQIRKIALDIPFIFLTPEGKITNEIQYHTKGEHCSTKSLSEILRKTQGGVKNHTLKGMACN